MFSSVGFGRFIVACPSWRPTQSYEGRNRGSNISWGYLVHMEKETNSAMYEWLPN